MAARQWIPFLKFALTMGFLRRLKGGRSCRHEQSTEYARYSQGRASTGGVTLCLVHTADVWRWCFHHRGQHASFVLLGGPQGNSAPSPSLLVPERSVVLNRFPRTDPTLTIIKGDCTAAPSYVLERCEGGMLVKKGRHCMDATLRLVFFLCSSLNSSR